MKITNVWDLPSGIAYAVAAYTGKLRRGGRAARAQEAPEHREQVCHSDITEGGLPLHKDGSLPSVDVGEVQTPSELSPVDPVRACLCGCHTTHSRGKVEEVSLNTNPAESGRLVGCSCPNCPRASGAIGIRK